MMNSKLSHYVLALDLGTTGNRAMLFDAQGTVTGGAYKELTQYYPQQGWVEHNPLEIWQDTRECIEQVLKVEKQSTRQLTHWTEGVTRRLKRLSRENVTLLR